MITVALLDDHELFRMGISELFKKSEDIQLVASYASIEGCAKNLKKDIPDILLLDLDIDDDLGFVAIDKFRRLDSDLKIVMLTMYKKEFYVIRALELNVNGYITKDVNQDELFFGLKKVAKGEKFYSSEITNILINNIYARAGKPKSGIQDLTEREREILHYIMHGFSSPEIANKICISRKTVDNHRANILRKFGFKSTSMLLKELSSTGEI